MCQTTLFGRRNKELSERARWAMCQATQLSQKQGKLSKRNLQYYVDERSSERSSDSFQCIDSSEIIRKELSPRIKKYDN